MGHLDQWIFFNCYNCNSNQNVLSFIEVTAVLIYACQFPLTITVTHHTAINSGYHIKNKFVSFVLNTAVQLKNSKCAPFLNAVPEYSWKITEMEVNVTEGESSMQLEVTILRSSITNSHHEFCTRACPSESFRLLNETADSKLRWVCTS